MSPTRFSGGKLSLVEIGAGTAGAAIVSVSTEIGASFFAESLTSGLACFEPICFFPEIRLIIKIVKKVLTILEPVCGVLLYPWLLETETL